MRKLKIEELNRLSVEEFKASKKTPIIVVLDNIRSMNNIGSVFRTSDAFRINSIILTGITAQPPHRDINKTAIGATETVAWQYVESVETAISQLKEDGYMIAAIEQVAESVPLNSFSPQPEEKYALIFGNEVKGVSDEAMALADLSLEIPQIGSKHSLNISVSAGIVLWDLAQKLRVFPT